MKQFFKAFKSGFKQYWNSLRYILPIIGIFSIAIAIVVTLSIGEYTSIITDSTSQVRNLLIDKYHLTTSAVNEFINEIGKNINLADPAGAFAKLTNPEFIKGILDSCPSFKSIVTTDLVKDITDIVKSFGDQIKTTNNTVMLGVGIGLIVSYVSIQWFMDRQIKGSGLLKFIISFAVKVILALIFIGYTLYITNKYTAPVSYLLMDLFYIPVILVSMAESRVFYSKKYITTKEIFNFPNLIGIFASSLIIYGISATVSGVLFAFAGPLIGFMVGGPLIEISYIVTSTSARYLVGSIVDERKALERPKQKAT